LYTLTLREYRFIQLKQVGESGTTRPDERPTPTGYTVKDGDTLWLIAQRVYGDGSRWSDLYAANQDVIGPDPDLILPGQQLVISA
ncbi:MAG: LysM peptidoglycan-binding domain-containing protein, partial [Firmicutes bacterium]|nr:LysM peptidoglycan-binding domain-containing protein [Bacillota bacterium]